MKPLKLFRQEIFSPKNKTAKQLTGHAGEVAVAKRYKADGYTVVARNLHVARNELDLVVCNKTHIVFVEVKTRTQTVTDRRYGRPATAMTQAKWEHIFFAARAYMSANPHLTDKPRLDVLEVYLAPDRQTVREIKHYPAAYTA